VGGGDLDLGKDGRGVSLPEMGNEEHGEEGGHLWGTSREEEEQLLLNH